MNKNNNSSYKKQPVQRKSIISCKPLKPITVLAVVLLIAVLTGMASYLGGVKVEEKKLTAQLTLKVTPTTSMQPMTTILPTLTQISCPPVHGEHVDSQTYQWKTYTCQSLGVSFLYPTNIDPEPSAIIIAGSNNDVVIHQAMGYIFRIAKFATNQSLSDWVKQYTDDPSFSSFIVTQTKFHGYSAYLLEQAPEAIQGQVAENEYIVKAGPATLYKIEYAIPDPRHPEVNEDNYLLTTGMQKILDSITFLTAQ